MTRRLGSGSCALIAALAVGMLAIAGAACAKSPHKTKTHSKAGHAARWWPSQDVEHLKLKFGPIAIRPGQNNIKFDVVKQRPTVPGWIVSFKPDLIYAATGKVPAVDVIHLHHGVWLVNGAPTFAAGEEKTRVYSPQGFGYPYSLSDRWALTYMIHNLTPQPTSVYLTYDISFIPATSPQAKGIIPVHTQWLDVEGGHVYPVFDVIKGSGTNGTFTYPTQANNPYGSGAKLNQWVVPNDETIVGSAGHLHPGGLYDSLWDTRNGTTVLLFRSRAHYFEPAGTVSWDVAMIGTPPDWRVAVKKGDVLSVTATYNSGRSSWYEAMGIMPLQITDDAQGGLDPFTHNVAVAGILNHGHLPENNNHGGATAILPDATMLRDGPLTTSQLPIDNFIYGQGDLTRAGAAGRPPTIRQGQSLTFVNDDAGKNIWHTITSCRAPCNATTGIAYPLADGQPSFDSGELGTAPNGLPPAAGRSTWSTPPTLPAGTYTYFCRIHPFMRGSFRVLPAQ